MKSVISAAAVATVASASLLNVKHNVRENFGAHRVVEIPHEHATTEGVANLLTEHSADRFGLGEDAAHFKITPEALKALEEQNIEFKDTTEEWIAHFEENFSDENFMCFGDDCATRDMQAFYSSYQTLPALHSRAQSIVAGVDFASISSIGQSYEGRDQLIVEFGDGDKPLVFYFCNIHAREWLTPMYCMYMVENLAANGGHPLLSTFDFTVLISTNPDGYVYSYETNSQWRKTRRPNSGSSCVGTDPNRNFDNNHCGAGTSNNPCSETFCGPSPFSEVEVLNVANYAVAHSDRLIAMLDVHSYSQLWMYPYGAFSGTTPDVAKQDQCSVAAVNAIFATSGASWEYGPIYSTIYPAAGTSVDWFYDTPGTTYAMTAELRGTSFQPSASNILPSNQEVFAAMVASLTCVKTLEGFPGDAIPTAPPAPTPPPTPSCIFFC